MIPKRGGGLQPHAFLYNYRFGVVGFWHRTPEEDRYSTLPLSEEVLKQQLIDAKSTPNLTPLEIALVGVSQKANFPLGIGGPGKLFVTVSGILSTRSRV